MNLTIIPARGGSKRIPRKNIRDFCGKPMIAWSIDAARASGLFEHVVVSTDDDEIAEVARAHGAEVPFRRPAELADDHTGTTEVIAHATRWLLDRGRSVEAVCCLYATAPFVRAEDILRGLDWLRSGDWAYAFTATEYAAPIFRSFHVHPQGGIKMFFPEHFTTRSRDLPVALHDAGQFYWGRPKAWLEHKRIFARHSCPLLIPRWRVHDIDTDRLQHSVRRNRCRVSRNPGGALLQDRLVREHRYSADPQGRRHRQADDHLDRHGHGRRAGRNRARRPRGRLPRSDPAQVHQHLSRHAGEQPSAHHPSPARAVRLRSGPVRPHHGCRRRRAAVALGATVIEKHFTLRRADGGVDSAFSLESEELTLLVTETERAWQALGEVRYGPTDAERASVRFRRSLYVVQDLKAGDVLTRDNVRAIRPGLGSAPKYYDRYSARQAGEPGGQEGDAGELGDDRLIRRVP